MVSVWGVLLGRILAIRRLLVFLGRRRIGSLGLVRRLRGRIRADGLGRILALLVLLLRGILCGWVGSRLRLKRSLLLSLSIMLGLHGNGLRSGSLVVKQESAVLAALEEVVQGPSKGCNEKKPMFWVSDEKKPQKKFGSTYQTKAPRPAMAESMSPPLLNKMTSRLEMSRFL